MSPFRPHWSRRTVAALSAGIALVATGLSSVATAADAFELNDKTAQAKCTGYTFSVRKSYMVDGSKLVKDKDVGRMWVYRKQAGANTQFCAVAALRKGFAAKGITITIANTSKGDPKVAGPIVVPLTTDARVQSRVHQANGAWGATTSIVVKKLAGGGVIRPSTGEGASVPNGTGAAWPSGVYIGGDNPSSLAKFASWRGQPLDVVVVWPPRQTWGDFTGVVPTYSNFKSQSYAVAIGVPPFPEGGGDYNTCKSGGYDSQWKKFGNSLKSAGLGSRAIIRLGWEFNGDWYPHSQASRGFNAANFAACWRKIHAAVESVAPGVKWDWTVNRGPSQSLGNSVEAAYPGDAYVDFVGIDSYDQFPGIKSEANWNTHLNGPYGLNHWLKFAKAHGKKLSVPEWGVYPGKGANSGGDNPLYIQKMHDFFKANASFIGYEAYFNESMAYFGGAVYNPVQVPKASTKYNSLW